MSAERKLGRFGTAAVTAIFAAGSVVGAANAESPKQAASEPPSASEDQKPKEAFDEYQLPLKIWEDFIDIEANPDIADLHERASKDPSNHIEVVGPEGTRKVWNRNSFTYVIYDQAETAADDWSMLISVEDNGQDQSMTTVSVRFGENSEFYDGNPENLGEMGEIDSINLGIAADNVFNLPEELLGVTWEMTHLGEDWLGNPMYGQARFYQIDEDNRFTEVLIPNNVVRFSSPYPRRPDGNFANIPFSAPEEQASIMSSENRLGKASAVTLAALTAVGAAAVIVDQFRQSQAADQFYSDYQYGYTSFSGVEHTIRPNESLASFIRKNVKSSANQSYFERVDEKLRDWDYAGYFQKPFPKEDDIGNVYFSYYYFPERLDELSETFANLAYIKLLPPVMGDVHSYEAIGLYLDSNGKLSSTPGESPPTGTFSQEELNDLLARYFQLPDRMTDVEFTDGICKTFRGNGGLIQAGGLSNGYIFYSETKLEEYELTQA